MLKRDNKNIVIGITGGIAAYKSPFLIRLFKKVGWNVKVVASQNALEFVTPLTLETLSQNPLYYDTFEAKEEINVQHISLAEWADCMVVAPATANIIGKLANGIADDALSTLLLAIQKPLFVAPAMNENMYNHIAVQENMQKLMQRGVHFIEPSEGYLACGTEGKGRMEEPEVIFNRVMQLFQENERFAGKKVLITAGPTYEPIDPVRFVGNHSSGLMGFEIAQAFAEQGAQVELIAGPTHLQTHHSAIKRVDVTTAEEMYRAVTHVAGQADIIVMAAAVADYTPAEVAPEKLKKNDNSLILNLKKTKDILAEVGKQKKATQLLVGFALETENELQNAKTKLQNKNLDMIVLNSLKTKGAGFKTSTNQITIITKDEEVISGNLKTKKEVAADIINVIYQKLHLNIH